MWAWPESLPYQSVRPPSTDSMGFLWWPLCPTKPLGFSSLSLNTNWQACQDSRGFLLNLPYAHHAPKSLFLPNIYCGNLQTYRKLKELETPAYPPPWLPHWHNHWSDSHFCVPRPLSIHQSLTSSASKVNHSNSTSPLNISTSTPSGEFNICSQIFSSEVKFTYGEINKFVEFWSMFAPVWPQIPFMTENIAISTECLPTPLSRQSTHYLLSHSHRWILPVIKMNSAYLSYMQNTSCEMLG